MITVIDSGIANIGSVLSACRRIGVATAVTTNAREVASAEALILPGVGAFSNGMESLRRHDLVGPIRDAAAVGTPILGICLGMQLLADKSED
jgi:imidazole glycerol-phosphate synthase subunit HisH